MPLPGDHRLTTLLGRLALLLASMVALTLPLGHFVLKYQDLAYQIDTQAQFRAGVITSLVTGNPKMWMYQVQRLEELLTRFPAAAPGDAESVYDAQGTLVLRVGLSPGWPQLRRAHSLYDSGRVVGRVEVAHSLRGVLYSCAFTALLGLLLGGAVYGVLRAWPMRALRKMSAELEAEHAAVRAREERFRVLFDRASDGILIVSPSGELLAANEAFARMHGYSVNELLAMNLSDLDTPKTREHLAERMQQLLSGEAATFEVEHYHRDGRIIELEVSSSLILSEGKPLLQAFHRDITARKQEEAERALLEEQLRQSQKMEALGTLAGGVAHDFNNALATIFGNVELVRQDLDTGHLARESLEEIEKAARRAKALVQQILAFGRRQPLDRRPVLLAPTVEESARLLRATLPAGVSLNVVCAPDAPPVLADANQVQQVLLNLCTNAWQAIVADSGRSQASGGMIEIRLEAHVVDQSAATRPEWRWPRERPYQPGRYACLTVRDNGPGMDIATQQRIFEPFFTTKPVSMGTGLGLAVVHGIVQAHGARLEVQSAPGEGTIFRIYFAALDATAAFSAEPEARADTTPAMRGARDSDAPRLPQGSGKHVLYIDDDEAIVLLMTRLLERQGYRVSGHTDAHKAVAAVRANPHEFDLAVTDYNMPGMSGLEVAYALKHIRSDLPVAIVSGNITEELRQRAPAAGISELIYKPNTATELCAAVARLASSLASH